MGPVGVQEMIVIFLVALVLFGPKKLPELGKTIGKAITEFRRAQSELKSTFETHMRELEKENESIKEVTRSYTDEIYSHYTGYDNSYSDSVAASADPNAAATTAASSAATGIAPNGAEVSLPQETPANGTTVPRGANIETAAAQTAPEAAPTDSHPAAHS